MVSRFAITLFVSATLLFACQPMVARMIVPLLGGAPAVWILCSLFYQALVLGGYLYAHVVSSRLGVRTQVILQLALVASAFLALPVVVDEALVQSLTEKSRSLGLLAVLLRSVGLPFFVLSTTSPLLQRWYADLGETDPYHLYAASNAGSMLALLAYPFAVEPFLALDGQSRLLHIAYAGYAVLIFVCAIAMVRKRRDTRVDATPAPAGVTGTDGASRTHAGMRSNEEKESSSRFPPATTRELWRERLIWIGLAFAPSSLLLGATEFITTDLASIPLLWVVPLALYLASFIVAFARKQMVTPYLAWRSVAILAAAVAISKLAEVLGPAWLIVALHLLLLFAGAVVCHCALALRRPHHARLTEFYLLLSLGGVLGGVFNGLVAPVIFNDLLEYPIAIGLVCLACLAVEEKKDPPEHASAMKRDVGCGLALVALTYVLVKVAEATHSSPKLSVIWMYVLPVLVAFAWSKRPVRYAVALGGILLVGTVHGSLSGSTIHKERDFFDVLKVRRDPKGRYLMLLSGSTIHGAQSTDPAQKYMPATYFHPTGPAGDVFGRLRGASGGSLDQPVAKQRRVGVLGLGVGSLAAYAKPGEAWTFFELNPRCVEFARSYFTYLSDMPKDVDVDVEVGDGRLSVRKGAPTRFDLLVLDAFTSDAIPVHLVTREAFAIYRRALAPDGVLLANVTNRHVRLEPLFAALAADAKWLAIGREDHDVTTGARDMQKTASHWVVLSASKQALEAVKAKNAGWRWLPPPTRQKVWTDDFSDVLGAMEF